MNISSAYQICEAIIKDNSRSFYTAFKDLPLDKRNAVFAVYAFCRKVDDAIDVHQDASELTVYETYLDKIRLDLDDEDPVFLALKDSVKRFELDLKPFYDLIQGQRLDLDFHQPDNEESLLEYCYYVASTVGLMLLPILARQHHKSLTQTAIVLGYAMQLTNILRDIGEDDTINRLYLPSQDLTPAVLRAIHERQVTAEFIEVWEKWANKAESYYEEAASRISDFDEDARVPLLQALVYYKAILNAVRAAQYDCLTKRQSVSDYLSLKKEINQRLRKVTP